MTVVPLEMTVVSLEMTVVPLELMENFMHDYIYYR